MDHSRKNYSDCFSLLAIAFVIIAFLLIRDPGTTAALRWLAVVFCISFFLRPYLADRADTFDKRFGLRFGLGLFLCFYLSWMISAVFGVDYSDIVCHAVFIILAIGGYVIRRFYKKSPYVTRDELSGYLAGSAIFAVIFLAFFWIIGFNPSVDPGTENYMDFGFMQTIYRQKAAIPKDIWFAGETLNYYYLGQSASVYMCIISHTTPEYGYNLMLATFIGMVFLMVAEIVYSVAVTLLAKDDKKRVPALIGSMAGGGIAAFAANPHWLIYGIVLAAVDKIKGVGDERPYWFPDGTVYIRSELGDPDNGKNEFPAYSVILGDLHAHVINVIFVLPLVCLLFDCCFSDDEKEEKIPQLLKIVLIGMLLGYYKGSNYWDFAIYYVITGAVIVFTDQKRRISLAESFGWILAKALIITVVSLVMIIPFSLHFVKMESGIELADVHSPLSKLLVLWGLPVAAAAILIYILYEKRGRNDFPPLARSGLLAFILCTIGLVITPEFIYVKDIYGDANARFNTMFKLTYQAFVLFAIIIGVMLAIALSRALSGRDSSRIYAALSAATLVLILLSVAYMPHAVSDWFGNVCDPSIRKGISGLDDLRSDGTYGFEMQAYDILSADPKRVLNIVEVAGDSYTHESALSAYSGACTPAGWFVHEWMWHNDAGPIKDRADRVSYFYRCGDEEYCRDFLKLYDIDYILVGPAEVCKYPVNRNGFIHLGEACISTIWQDVELSLIKVDRNRL